ncbi:cell division protein ZapD [Ferrimonas balearica]|uniref:cell division protein ZapD n=1 Tax=Ferrimonas balearica TaxID=44012 RepID=UPI001C9993A3|nr:cell division protein ZapD [Ferrimonas balearica]MBY5992133.1 cell division protein ZapD [Ferrimonas balearica]
MLLVYEQPLNEKVRNYLRIETVAAQVEAHGRFDHPGAEWAFFRSLFELGELLERADLRSEALKDLERQLNHVALWRQAANVDQEQLNALEAQFTGLLQGLQKLTRPGQHLKTDRFLSALRQRMTIPGGYGSFDLPQFHHWQALPVEDKVAQAQSWRQELSPMVDTVRLLLTMLRETGRWTEQIAMNGCYQETSEQGLELLRVQVKQEYGVYPTISAHRHRYTIHLINYETGKGDNRNLPVRLSLSMEAK